MLRKSVRSALVATLAAAPALAQEAPSPGPRGPEIVAGGEGMRTVAADRATLIVSVETRARTPSEAGAANAAQNNRIRAAIAAVGVPRDDIATYGYNVYAMRQEPPFTRDTGFVATNAMRITIRRPEQLALVGRVIDTALTAGATHIRGVHYEARRTDEAEREALADALADARARAEAVARAAGGTLGELIQATTSPGPIMPREMDFAAAGMMRAPAARMRVEATTLTAGEIEVRQYVSARWRFVPGAR